MDKSPDAFRTISEVAEVLETPAHVLRFWESRFPQIRPVKRAGGRRYYRPNDVALLTGIKHLLHAEGMTIRGVQKVLRDQGVRHVAGLIGAELSDLDLDADAALSAALAANFNIETPEDKQTESAMILPLDPNLRRPAAPATNPAAPEAPRAPELPLSPEGFASIGEAFMALRALPRGALSRHAKAAQLLARARVLHARLLDNPAKDAL